MLNTPKPSVSIVPLLVVITAVIFLAAAAASGGLVPSAGADAADAPDAIGSGAAGCSSNTTARALGVDGGLMGLLFDRSAQTAYADSSVSECTMAFGTSGS